MHEDSTPDAGIQARDLAEAANPALSENIGSKVAAMAREQKSKLLENLKIGDPESCGRLTMLFKNEADPAYGVLSMQFDPQGNLLMEEAHNPGSQVADGVTEDMKKTEAGDQIRQGIPVITQIAPTCKL